MTQRESFPLGWTPLNNVDGNRFTRYSYKGITLSAVISKVFEPVLLLQFKIS